MVLPILFLVSHFFHFGGKSEAVYGIPDFFYILFLMGLYILHGVIQPAGNVFSASILVEGEDVIITDSIFLNDLDDV